MSEYIISRFCQPARYPANQPQPSIHYKILSTKPFSRTSKPTRPPIHSSIVCSWWKRASHAILIIHTHTNMVTRCCAHARIHTHLLGTLAAAARKDLEAQVKR